MAMIRTNVVFRYPMPFVSWPDTDGVLSVDGAGWLVELLRQVPELDVQNELCQEDWGVVAFAERAGKRFWIGLSQWPDAEDAWLMHVHHGSFQWLQWFSSSGRLALEELVCAVAEALKKHEGITDVAWYHERAMMSANPLGAASPRDS